MTKETPNIALTWLKRAGIFLLVLFLLAIGIRILAGSGFAHQDVKKTIINLAGESLNGSLNISEIEGNLLKEIRIIGLEVSMDEPIAKADTIYARYSLWSLLSSTFEVSELSVSGLHSTIREQEDSLFNIQNLVIPDEDTTASTFWISLPNITLSNSSVEVFSPTYLPDQKLALKNLQLSASILFEEELSATLNNLSFSLMEGRLPEPITFKASADYSDSEISLNRLIIDTGQSLVQASAFFNPENENVTANIEALPFSFKDLEPYLNVEIPSDAVQLSLSFGGALDDLEIIVEGKSTGVGNFTVTTNLSLLDTLKVNTVGLSARDINIGYLTNEEIPAFIQEIRMSATGSIPQDYKEMDIVWGFTLVGTQYEHLNIDRFFGSGFVKDDIFKGSIELWRSDNEKIRIRPDITALFEENADWKIGLDIERLNVGEWVNDESLISDISFRGNAAGKGYQLSDEEWTLNLAYSSYYNDRIIFMNRRLPKPPDFSMFGQTLDELMVEGRITQNEAYFATNLQKKTSEINLTLNAEEYLSAVPSYDFKLIGNSLNLTDFDGFENQPTNLNFEASGRGSGLSSETLSLRGFILMDSSSVNNAKIEYLESDFTVEEGFFIMNNGGLKSEITDASFEARKFLLDEYHPTNSLSFEANLKNPQPLAVFTNFETLRGTGNLSAQIRENETGVLQCEATLNLIDVKIDDLLLTEGIEGFAEGNISDEQDFMADLLIKSPTINGISFEDFEFKTEGNSRNDSLSGSFNLKLSSVDTGSISPSGSYELDLNSIDAKIVLFTLDLETPLQILRLERPFTINYTSSSLSTDTLSLQSDQNSYLKMSISRLDSLVQEVWIEGDNFDFGVIQEIAFGERFVDGKLFGNVNATIQPDYVYSKGSFRVEELVYKETEIDNFGLDFNIEDERLNAVSLIHIDENEILNANVDIPFKLGEPTTFEAAFFEEPVYGKLEIQPIDLSRFEPLLKSMGIDQTSGVFSTNASLEGTAGEPRLKGNIILQKPTISGIRVDSAFANFTYNNAEQMVMIDGGLDAVGQRAANLKIEYPLSINFRTFEMNTPNENEMINAELLTNDFNISVFNDFLDKAYLSNLKGMLNGVISLQGELGSLEPSGNLSLTDSEVSVPIAGITLSNIKSEFEFDKDGLIVRNISAESGRGSFNSSGRINMDGIYPSTVELTAKANQFRLANTDAYNVVIDLDSQLKGKAQRPTISGKLSIKNGFVFLENFGERSVEEVVLEGEEESSFSPYDSLAIQMQFEIERNFYVRNRRYLDMEIEIAGNLDAQKETNGELELFGTLSGVEGYLRPLGKRFNLEEADLLFSGPVDNPNLNIRSSYLPGSRQNEGAPIELYYVVSGTAQNPEFSFDSDPKMEQQDIISYTLFGRPFYALDSWQQVMSDGSGGPSPTNLLMDVLLDEVEALATRELGIDVVQIDNTRTGSETGTAVKTGWYLNDRTFFAIVNEFGNSNPQTLFILEYILSKNLDLIMTQGDDTRQGVDLRFKYDY